MKEKIKAALIEKLKDQFEGSFDDAYGEVCEELGTDPESLRAFAQDAWIRNATRFL